jgi:hypothetical protein
VTCNNNRTENWLPQIDIIVIYSGHMRVENGNVSVSVGVEPGAALTGLTKVSYPIDVDIFSGGKFDLGSLLASIPGRLVKGVSGLVSGLLGSEDTSGTQSGPSVAPAATSEVLNELTPAMLRKLRRLLMS